MKTVICNSNLIARVSDANGNTLLKPHIKVPEKGKPYTVTGEYRQNGFLYYFLMGFGIKTVFKSELFQDA